MTWIKTKGEALDYIIIYIGILLSGSIIILSTSILAEVMAFLLLTGIAVVVVRFDILHPYCWFGGIFSLYSLSYSILYITGNLGEWLIRKFSHSSELIFLQWLFFCIILLIVSPKRNKQKRTSGNSLKISTMNYIIYFLIFLIIGLSIISISQQNFQHKREIYAANCLLYKFAFSAVYIVETMYVFFLLNMKDAFHSSYKKTVLPFGVLLFLMSMYSGERDIFFSFLLLTIFVLYDKHVIKKLHFTFLVPIGILLIPLSAIYKGFFLTGKAYGSLSIHTFIQQFFDGEFRSASQNVQGLIHFHEQTKGIFPYSQILTDIFRIFKSELPNTIEWYKEMFWNYTQTGYGFTLVGEGYVIGGIVGIAVIAVIVGITIKLLYVYSKETCYAKTLYICSIPSIIYAIRADLTNIYSPIIKHVVLALIMLFVVQKFFIRKMAYFKNAPY